MRAELHSNSTLDRGDLHIPLGRSAIEGSVDLGGTRPISGRKRCPPKTLSSSPPHAPLGRMELEAAASDRPAPPGTNHPASSIREK